LLGFVLFLIMVLFGLGVTLLAYASIARTLPPPGELAVRAGRAQTRIYDRDGNLLQTPLAPDDPTAGLRRRISLDEVSPYLVAATIATEDANFYRHRGVDPVALGRAVFRALQTQSPVMGTSTISQQLVKLVFLSPERTVSRKVKEAILAAEITRRYDKNAVLALYLNEIYYGNLAYGAEAAAQVYFDKAAKDLTLAEAALLAGLPQSPATYDPLQNPEAAKARQADVLRLMVEHQVISAEEADAAWLEPLQYYGRGLEATALDKAPHFVMFVRSQVEQRYGPDLLYRGGLEIYTTLDNSLQTEAEAAVREGVNRLRLQNVSNGSLVALRPASGEILAMVGSADFDDPEISGQVNVALAPRQPGSAIKPFTYLATFERETDYWTPATIVEDDRTEFDDGPGRPPYVPVNYDGREHGPVSARTALANSYNIPAVKALQHVGVDRLLVVAERFGLKTLTRADHPPYGLSLTLGGGEVTLLELAGAYGALANNGNLAPPAAILCILDSEGRALERLEVDGLPAACQEAPLAPNATVSPPPAQAASSPQHAYLITDILKDNEARVPVFGPNSALRLKRPAAAKTGTTNDVRDGWTIGYTPDLVGGVWVGNSDGSPMNQSLSGSQVAAPIWNRFMSFALASTAPRDFSVPEGIQRVEICRASGTVADILCPPDQRREEVFAAGQLPPAADSTNVQVTLAAPRDGETVQGVVAIVGSAMIPEFDHYLVEYGESHDPGAWGVVWGPIFEPVEQGQLAWWDVESLPKDGPHVLRVVAVDKRGTRVESSIARLFVVHSSPTATATKLPSPTVTATPSPTRPLSPTVTITPSPTRPLSPTATAAMTPPPTTAPPTATASPTVPSPTNTTSPRTPTPTATLVPPSPTATQFAPTPTATPSQAGPAATPTGTPGATDPGLIALIDWPRDGITVSGFLSITGVAGGTDFASYRLEFRGTEDWQPVAPEAPVVYSQRLGQLAVWDTPALINGPYTLRLRVQNASGQEVVDTVAVTVAN
jgi:1A family penicillin-binding protein